MKPIASLDTRSTISDSKAFSVFVWSKLHDTFCQGDESRSFVRTGNDLAKLSSILYFVAFCLQINVIIEQPFVLLPSAVCIYEVGTILQ